MRLRLRTACTGLDAQVATGVVWVEVVTEERWQGRERLRRLGCDSETICSVRGAEQRRPETEGDGQIARRQPERLTGIVRWRLR